MKKCPYCAEEIQEEAVLCRYCKSRLDTYIDESQEVFNSSSDYKKTTASETIEKKENTCNKCSNDKKLSVHGTSTAAIVLGIVGGGIAVPSAFFSAITAGLSLAIGSAFTDSITGADIGESTGMMLIIGLLSGYLSIFGGIFAKRLPKTAGFLMISACIIGAISFFSTFNVLGVCSLILMLIGGIIAFVQKKELVNYKEPDCPHAWSLAKKIVAIITAVICVISLFRCGAVFSASDSSDNNQEEIETTTATVSETTTPVTTIITTTTPVTTTVKTTTTTASAITAPINENIVSWENLLWETDVKVYGYENGINTFFLYSDSTFVFYHDESEFDTFYAYYEGTYSVVENTLTLNVTNTNSSYYIDKIVLKYDITNDIMTWNADYDGFSAFKQFYGIDVTKVSTEQYEAWQNGEYTIGQCLSQIAHSNRMNISYPEKGIEIFIIDSYSDYIVTDYTMNDSEYSFALSGVNNGDFGWYTISYIIIPAMP